MFVLTYAVYLLFYISSFVKHSEFSFSLRFYICSQKIYWTNIFVWFKTVDSPAGLDQIMFREQCQHRKDCSSKSVPNCFLRLKRNVRIVNVSVYLAVRLVFFLLDFEIDFFPSIFLFLNNNGGIKHLAERKKQPVRHAQWGA